MGILSRLDRKRGRFDATYEAGLASDAMLDHQDVYGDWADYYRYDHEESHYHPIYDEPSSGGRVFAGPIRIPVIRLVREEGNPDRMPGGLYWTDTLHVTVPVAGLELAGLEAADIKHGHYVRDRLVYDDRVFRVSRISVLGQVRRRDLVAGIDAIQLKPEDLRGDMQFAAWHEQETRGLPPAPVWPSDPSWPGPHNTGVPSGRLLTSSGSITVHVDGTVIDGLDVEGEITVEANNVTIRNSRIRGQQDYWGITQREGYNGLTVEDCEIFGNGTQRTQFGILNQGLWVTIRRVNVHTTSNGIHTNQGLVEDCFVHDPLYYPEDHTDMIMATSTAANGMGLVIRHNTVLNTLNQTGAIALFQDFGVIRNVTLENNLLAGGGWALYAGAGGAGLSSDIKVINNVFSRHVWPECGSAGPVAYWDSQGPGNVWSGNVWEDGGTVPAPP